MLRYSERTGANRLLRMDAFADHTTKVCKGWHANQETSYLCCILDLLSVLHSRARPKPKHASAVVVTWYIPLCFRSPSFLHQNPTQIYLISPTPPAIIIHHMLSSLWPTLEIGSTYSDPDCVIDGSEGWLNPIIMITTIFQQTSVLQGSLAIFNGS